MTPWCSGSAADCCFSDLALIPILACWEVTMVSILDVGPLRKYVFWQFVSQPSHKHNLTSSSDRILIIGGSRSGKTNALFNLIGHQQDIDKSYLYAKNPYEVKY